MNEYKVSIIIPVYNSEKVLANCLDSILSSTVSPERYEIVIINDGTQDGSMAIAEGYAAAHPNIRLLSQENQGQGVARNNGFRHCHGEYVWCVDPDDEVVSTELPKLLGLLDSHPHLDILAVELQTVSESGEPIGLECHQQTVKHHAVLSGRDAILQGYQPSSMCALLTRRALLTEHDIWFKEGTMHEDVILSYQLMAVAQNVYFSDLIPYLYIQHTASTSNPADLQMQTKYLTDDIVVMEAFAALAAGLQSHDPQLSARIAQHAKRMQIGMAVNLLTHWLQWRKEGIYREVISQMRAAGYFPLKGDFGSRKRNFFRPLLNLLLSIS